AVLLVPAAPVLRRVLRHPASRLGRFAASEPETRPPLEGRRGALTPPPGRVSLTQVGSCPRRCHHGSPPIRAPRRDRGGCRPARAPGVHPHRPGPRSHRVSARPPFRDAPRSPHADRVGGAFVPLRSDHLAARWRRDGGGPPGPT